MKQEGKANCAVGGLLLLFGTPVILLLAAKMAFNMFV